MLNGMYLSPQASGHEVFPSLRKLKNTVFTAFHLICSINGTIMTDNASQANFPAGIIEGFFGTPWDMKTRMAFIENLKGFGLNFYIYAPKNDSCLRRIWFEDFTKEYLSELKRLSDRVKSCGMKFGIGFSPLGATAEPDKYLPVFMKQVQKLVTELQPEYFALLFDDMKISLEHEGALQNTFIKECYRIVRPHGIHLITCSSFYTTDPILEKVFGRMPETYYQDLLRDIPRDVDFFWTGSKVISTDYTAGDLKLAAELLGRKPFIWDNYPVNDGKKASDHLYLRHFNNRQNIRNLASGIAVNPMKQTFLNLFPLASVSKALETDDDKDIVTSALQKLSVNQSREFIDFIRSNSEMFASVPLPELTEEMKESLLTKLESFKAGADNRELIQIRELQDFLNRRYVFDPACLTG